MLCYVILEKNRILPYITLIKVSKKKLVLTQNWVPSAKFGTWQNGLAPGKNILALGNFLLFRKIGLAAGER